MLLFSALDRNVVQSTYAIGWPSLVIDRMKHRKTSCRAVECAVNSFLPFFTGSSGHIISNSYFIPQWNGRENAFPLIKFFILRTREFSCYKSFLELELHLVEHLWQLLN